MHNVQSERASPRELNHSSRRRTLRLLERRTITLSATAPFDFDGTMHNPSHFPSQEVAWEPGKRWQTMRWRGRTYGLRLQPGGSPTGPHVRLTIYSNRSVTQSVVDGIGREIADRFDLASAAIPAFVRKYRHDRLLGPVIRRRPGMRASSGVSLYEFLVITVMLQNTVVRRSVSMLQALFGRYGRRVAFDGRTLWAFWDPQHIAAVSEDELRRLRLGYRAKTLKRQADHFAAGQIDEAAWRALPTDELRAALDDLYGVGTQSAGYLLFEMFHRPEPQGPLSRWEGTIMAHLLFGRPGSLRAVERTMRQRYGEDRALAFHYLFTDLFWRHREQPIPWLEPMIRL